MGNYSYFRDQSEIKIKEDISWNDFKVLKKALHPIINEDGEINFSNWDGNKIQGYWYETTVKVLELLAKYLDLNKDEEAYVTFDYEHESLFQIVFKNKEVFVRNQILSEIKFGKIEKIKR